MLIAFFTESLAELIVLVITVLTLFQIDEAVAAIELNIDETLVDRFLNVVEAVETILAHILDNAADMLLHILEAVEAIN